MKFDIKCATFARLASVCSVFEPTVEPDVRDKLNTVRLECSNGKLFAIVTNQTVAAIEVIGHVDPALKDVVHLRILPDLLTQCKAESRLDHNLSISIIPEINMSMITTTSGWVAPSDVCHWDHSLLNGWRKWVSDEPITENKYAMYWNLFQVHALLESSPSGKVIFPRFIDASKPVVLRDIHNANWVGLFVPKLPNNNMAAELPEWWRN